MAQACGIEDDLGEKGKRGVLKSQASRAAFLSDAGHRIRFVYTPKHSSWLNQVEIWFSILVRKLLRRSSFRRWKTSRRGSWRSSTTSTGRWPSRSTGSTRRRRNQETRLVRDFCRRVLVPEGDLMSDAHGQTDPVEQAPSSAFDVPDAGGDPDRSRTL